MSGLLERAEAAHDAEVEQAQRAEENNRESAGRTTRNLLGKVLGVEIAENYPVVVTLNDVDRRKAWLYGSERYLGTTTYEGLDFRVRKDERRTFLTEVRHHDQWRAFTSLAGLWRVLQSDPVEPEPEPEAPAERDVRDVIFEALERTGVMDVLRHDHGCRGCSG